MVPNSTTYKEVDNIGDYIVPEEKKVVYIPTLEEHHYFLFNKEFDAISTGEAMTFILQRNLMKENRPENIKMIINSPGGEMDSMFALVDTMKGSKIPVHTYGLGEISSAGLFTFIAGQKGKRFVTRNTTIMSHQYFAGVLGKEHEIMGTYKHFNLSSKRLMEHVKLCTGLKETQIKKYLLTPTDVYLSAKEAVKLGIADEIISFY